jgi:hypothetical protein
MKLRELIDITELENDSIVIALKTNYRKNKFNNYYHVFDQFTYTDLMNDDIKSENTEIKGCTYGYIMGLEIEEVELSLYNCEHVILIKLVTSEFCNSKWEITDDTGNYCQWVKQLSEFEFEVLETEILNLEGVSDRVRVYHNSIDVRDLELAEVFELRDTFGYGKHEPLENQIIAEMWAEIYGRDN